MKISDLLKLSFDNLKRRKSRTILTVLGVVIGTCSIVMMVSIGVALDKSYDDMLTGLGDLTLIEVYNWSSSNEVDPLTDKKIDEFAKLPNVTVATPIYQSNYIDLQFYSGNNDKFQAWGQIRGMRRDAIEAYGYELDEGHFPSQGDKEYSVVVGELFAYQFQNVKKNYPNNMVDPYDVDENGNKPKPFVNVMHDKIKIKTMGWSNDGNGEVKNVEKDINVVGVLKSDTSKGYESMYGVIMDINDLFSIENEYKKLNNIKEDSKKKEREYNEAIVKVKDINDVDEVVEAIEAEGYNTWSMASYRDSLKKETQLIQLILGGLGSISLFVSAIGIANTMTMAIYERTKEIGVMKVLGCELKDIKNMFLAEAAGIGFLGGVVGIVLCYGLSTLLNAVAGGMMGGGDTAISIIPIWLALFGLVFSTAVGIISGYVPAVKAVKVTALSAIRHD